MGAVLVSAVAPETGQVAGAVYGPPEVLKNAVVGCGDAMFVESAVVVEAEQAVDFVLVQDARGFTAR